MIHVVHHPDYVAPQPRMSRYQWNKNGLIREALHAGGLDLVWHEPEVMPLDWLTRVHCPDYVAEVIEARVPQAKERRIGFPVTPLVAQRAQRVPGGTYLAACLALDHGFATNTAGGSHHALHDTGAGYCVFNDLAVTAIRLVEEGRVGRILIVDVDVHQGDGTAALTAGHPGIATYSIHAEKNFPARKARSTLDVPLADGTGEAAYLAAFEQSVIPMIDEVRPDLILYQGGVDPLADDRLGRLALSQAGIDARDNFIAMAAVARHIPLASTPGGGYGSDLAEIANRHVRTIRNLGEVFIKAAEQPIRLRDGPESLLRGHASAAPGSIS